MAHQSIYGGRNLSELWITSQSYVYVPALKMVFFIFDIAYKGTMTKGETLVFKHTEASTGASVYKPQPIGGGTSYPVTARSGKFSGEYMSNEVWLYAEEAIDTGSYRSSVTVSGWYYTEGK
jgi:hypothetical protein